MDKDSLLGLMSENFLELNKKLEKISEDHDLLIETNSLVRQIDEREGRHNFELRGLIEKLTNTIERFVDKFNSTLLDHELRMKGFETEKDTKKNNVALAISLFSLLASFGALIRNLFKNP